jgi:DNA-directed RNA polymerase alpha subunit
MITEFLETPIAELASHGLNSHVINNIEEAFGLYVKDLEGVTEKDILEVQGIGELHLKSLIKSLKGLLTTLSRNKT